MRDFALYERLNDLSKWLFPVVDRFPQREKFALCTQIKNSVHSMVRYGIRANKALLNMSPRHPGGSIVNGVL